MADDDLSIEDQVRGWVTDEIRLRRFTDRVRYLLAWDRTPVMGPGGTPGMRITWKITLVMQSHLVGVPMAYHIEALGLVPDEQEIRDKVAAAIGQLRAARGTVTRTLAPQNGHGKLAIPGSH